MLDTWRRFLRLRRFERKIVLDATVALFATWAGLRLFGFRRWKEIGERLARGKNRNSRGASETPTDLELAQKIALLEAAAERRLILRVNCLERSLALLWLYRLRGIPAALQFGARKQGTLVE